MLNHGALNTNLNCGLGKSYKKVLYSLKLNTGTNKKYLNYGKIALFVNKVPEFFENAGYQTFFVQ